MELPKEQIPEIKKQLIQQIQTTFADDKKSDAIKQIESMNEEQLIDFLKQNNLINPENSSGQQGQCIFCSIIFGEVPSTKIGENEKAIAILEINPISKGHSLIIPKNHLGNPEKLETEVKNLAEEIKEKLQKTFSPKEIQLIPGNIMGHEIINVLPIYTNETINSQKNSETPEGLQKLKEEIENKPSKKEEVKKETKQENLVIPKRIP